jgi:hypothetical protein
MEVLLLTTLFSVVFAVFFLTLFIRDRQTRRFGGVEREALLPLDDDLPVETEDRKRPVAGDGGKISSPGIPAEETSV